MADVNALRSAMNDAALPNPVLQSAAKTIRREHRRKSYEATLSLWRIGDIVVSLRAAADQGDWRRTLEALAGAVGVGPAMLDEAARVSSAFPEPERLSLLRRFDDAEVPLKPSQIIQLARAAPAKRRRGIELLLFKPYSVRELRSGLRATL
jgi:hypothetical protein